jgi:CheY-like chemotaxis protein
MKILFIEDNSYKIDQVSAFIHGLPKSELEVKKSYHSGLKEVRKNYKKYDLILLDISMQFYDIKPGEYGGEPMPLAGKLILNDMDVRDIPTPVIVITMYEGLNGVLLPEFDRELKHSFPVNYKGYIYFMSNNEVWKTQLLTKLNHLSIC